MRDIFRIKLLKRMEALKLASRLNFVFTLIVLSLVALQVAFVVRVEHGEAAYVPASTIHTYSSKYIDNLALIFLPVLLLVNVTKEFEYGVVQRTLVSGFSRSDYLASKMLLVASFAVCSVFLALFFRVLTAVSHKIPVAWDHARLVMSFTVTFFMGSFALLLALLLRKSMHALAAFISYIVLENILLSIVQREELYRVLPFQVCVRILKQGREDLPEFIALTVFNAAFWLTGYWRIRKMDLQ